MWEDKAYEIGQRSYDDVAIQANQAISNAGLYAGIGVGAVALGSAYYVNAKSPAYNPEILQQRIADKKAKKLAKREQAVEEVVQRSNEEKVSTQTESAKELAILREEQRAKNREREEALNRRRTEREAQAEAPSEPIEKTPPTQQEIDKAQAEASASRQHLDDVAEKLEATKTETVGSRVDRKAKQDNVLRKALSKIKSIKL